MKSFKQLLCLSLIPLFLSTISLDAMAPIADTQARQLDEQMKSFGHRVRIYLKCLPHIGKCTPEERTAAGKTILKDSAIMLGTLIVLGASLFLGKKYAWPQWKEYRYQKLSDTVQKKEHEFRLARQEHITSANDYNRIQKEKPNSPEARAAYKKYEIAKKSDQNAEKELDKYKKPWLEQMNIRIDKFREYVIKTNTELINSNFYEPDPTIDTSEDMAEKAMVKGFIIQDLEDAEAEKALKKKKKK